MALSKNVIPFPRNGPIRGYQNGSKPRLPTDVEQNLESVEILSARCYLEIEEFSARFRDLASKIEEGLVREDLVPFVTD